MEKLHFNSDSRILIIAPHPDDETYGCGGVMLQHRGQCDVVLLAYGETGNPGWTKDRTLRVRREEFRTAVKMAGARIIAEFGIPNRKVYENAKLISELDYSEYDYIFVPNRKDKHPDHNCVVKAVRRARSLKKGVVILQYEMWGQLPDVTHYVDITDVIDGKEKLMLCYKSQEERLPYCARIKARDYYKAIETYDKKCQYAELFYLEPGAMTRFGKNMRFFFSELFKYIALLFR